ncbi:hypothetical protein GCM10007972_24790 [Iodidimonas muriae]|uniref:Plasmid pRiA4b Orf3-like domain-containing protein n=1 Tax=Iodidimonas muriae TaxID=261467 RepID=A0ABQ2LFV3_9PROT|nr:plasmid pRiA4b ORF-3 family protein [Iodidimonas muriae]GER08830.1 hypothetical protein JCM17843_31400 [Kordiimonadales bacterium JCM 17843]GGO16110.1 hypothetical protein GCM10007972_24790 [Iodidimonas muriae]
MVTVNPKTDILQIKITLLHLKPVVWRRVLVPAGLSLKRLHDTIQAAMGWYDQHMYEFHVGERRYGARDFDDGLDPGVADANNVKLSSLVANGVERFLYVYDFGDDWRHEIVIEAAKAAEPGIDYPIFVDGERRCPPEDCGGPPGFEALLEAISDPDHPDHEDVLDWLGEPYDPDDIERYIIDAQLSRIARSRRGGMKARGRPRKTG